MNQDLHELFLYELADLLDAETQLTKALPKVIKAVHSQVLAEAIASHLKETEEHVTRLEQVFNSLGEPIKREKCQAMKGLIAETEDIIKEEKDSSVLDAAIIAAAQKVEHYEIASYGTVCAWATQMGHTEALALLSQTLSEEKSADTKLTDIAESVANQEAAYHA